MGLFSRLFFWRKKEESESGYDDLDNQMNEQPDYPPQINPKLDYGSGQMQPQVQQHPMDSEDREFRIINDKLDIINSKLEVISQRLNSLEQRSQQKEVIQRW